MVFSHRLNSSSKHLSLQSFQAAFLQNLPIKSSRPSRSILNTRKLFLENLPLFIFLSLPPEIAFDLLNLENESPLSIVSFQSGSPLGSGLFFQ